MGTCRPIRYPPSVFWGSGPAFRALRVPGRWAPVAISAAAVCVVTACGGNPPAPKAPIATTLAAGSAALRQRDYWAAQQLFLQVIRRDPRQAAAYYDLGLAYQDQDNYRGALRAYASAQRLDENFVPAIYNSAVLYSRADPQLAMFLYRKAISLRPDSPTAYLNLGLLEAGRGPRLRDQAEKDLARAVRLEPSLEGRIPGPLRSALNTAGRSGSAKSR
jgi:tetratricopeptide (TPR) repeat protein